MNFKEQFTFEKRVAQANRILNQFEDHVPVIVEPANEKNARIEKTKFLAPKEYPVAKFILMLRKKINLGKDEAIFIFTEDNTSPTASETMGRLYEKKRNKDGFLYIQYALESAFG